MLAILFLSYLISSLDIQNNNNDASKIDEPNQKTNKKFSIFAPFIFLKRLILFIIYSILNLFRGFCRICKIPFKFLHDLIFDKIWNCFRNFVTNIFSRNSKTDSIIKPNIDDTESENSNITADSQSSQESETKETQSENLEGDQDKTNQLTENTENDKEADLPTETTKESESKETHDETSTDNQFNYENAGLKPKSVKKSSVIRSILSVILAPFDFIIKFINFIFLSIFQVIYLLFRILFWPIYKLNQFFLITAQSSQSIDYSEKPRLNLSFSIFASSNISYEHHASYGVSNLYNSTKNVFTCIITSPKKLLSFVLNSVSHIPRFSKHKAGSIQTSSDFDNQTSITSPEATPSADAENADEINEPVTPTNEQQEKIENSHETIQPDETTETEKQQNTEETTIPESESTSEQQESSKQASESSVPPAASFNPESESILLKIILAPFRFVMNLIAFIGMSLAKLVSSLFKFIFGLISHIPRFSKRKATNLPPAQSSSKIDSQATINFTEQTSADTEKQKQKEIIQHTENADEINEPVTPANEQQEKIENSHETIQSGETTETEKQQNKEETTIPESESTSEQQESSKQASESNVPPAATFNPESESILLKIILAPFRFVMNLITFIGMSLAKLVSSLFKFIFSLISHIPRFSKRKNANFPAESSQTSSDIGNQIDGTPNPIPSVDTDKLHQKNEQAQYDQTTQTEAEKTEQKNEQAQYDQTAQGEAEKNEQIKTDQTTQSEAEKTEQKNEQAQYDQTTQTEAEKNEQIETDQTAQTEAEKNEQAQYDQTTQTEAEKTEQKNEQVESDQIGENQKDKQAKVQPTPKDVNKGKQTNDDLTQPAESSTKQNEEQAVEPTGTETEKPKSESPTEKQHIEPVKQAEQPTSSAQPSKPEDDLNAEQSENQQDSKSEEQSSESTQTPQPIPTLPGSTFITSEDDLPSKKEYPPLDHRATTLDNQMDQAVNYLKNNIASLSSDFNLDEALSSIQKQLHNISETIKSGFNVLLSHHKAVSQRPDLELICLFDNQGNKTTISPLQKVFNIFGHPVYHIPANEQGRWEIGSSSGSLLYKFREQKIHTIKSIIFDPVPNETCCIKDFTFEFLNKDVNSSRIFHGGNVLQKGSTEQQIFSFDPYIQCTHFKVHVRSNWGNETGICHYGLNVVAVI